MLRLERHDNVVVRFLFPERLGPLRRDVRGLDQTGELILDIRDCPLPIANPLPFFPLLLLLAVDLVIQYAVLGLRVVNFLEPLLLLLERGHQGSRRDHVRLFRLLLRRRGFVHGNLVLAGICVKLLDLLVDLQELGLCAFPHLPLVLEVDPEPLQLVLLDLLQELVPLVESRDVALHVLHLLVQLLDASLLRGHLVLRSITGGNVGRIGKD